MKKIIYLILVLSLLQLNNLYAGVIKTQSIFDANNIRANIWNTGVLFQNLSSNNTSGFEWPKFSGKTAIFTSGLSIASYINGNLRMGVCSYNGEYAPGYIEASVPDNPQYRTNSIYKIYSIKAGDTQYSNPDYANWGLMVPYGAPYKDVNNNGSFEVNIDKPGIPDADQTIFICITDADPSNHTTSEGFSGGTLPVFAEVHMTLWGYNLPNLNNVLFSRYEIINKSGRPWTKSHFGLFCDSRLGNPNDDYIGCDSARNLSYTYNAGNNDSVYGANPPAVGFRFLKTPSFKNSQLGMTAFNYISFGNIFYQCLNEVYGSPLHAFNVLTGTRTDSSHWLNPSTVPPYPTNYCFSGNPEDSTGWTEYKGLICRDGTLIPSLPGNKRSIMVTGSDSLTIQPNRKFNIVFSTMIERGSSNLNSVSKLKNLSDISKLFFDQNFNFIDDDVSFVQSYPQISETYKLSQNYPNPFNPVTNIKFSIPENTFTELKIYDLNGKEIDVLENKFLTKGEYEYQWNAGELPSGIYFYKLVTQEFSQTKKMILIK